jgi:GDP-L-fucose synthase
MVGFRGRLEFDASKPDGTSRKLLDTRKLDALGWRARIGLREGVQMAYEDYLRVAQGARRLGAIAS